ncbi:hypothetical protein DL769_011210 [Monosporascus sp. CRB-8-3]|nr:hypothetical protein DL769_011210 [Monosporascus sp. CRB-8-3]
MASQQAVTDDAVELQQVDPRAESSNVSATINPHEIGPPEAQRRAGNSLAISPTLLVRHPQNGFSSAGFVFTWTNGILGVFDKLKERRSEVMTKALAIIGIIVACFALWPTFSSAKDGRKATLIAEWTAKKDFLEFCQSINYKDSGCDEAKGVSLGPPPNFSGRDWKRLAGASGDHELHHNWDHILPTDISVQTYGLVTPLASFTACGLLLFWKYGSLRRLRRLTLRSHFRSKHWKKSIYNWGYRLSRGTASTLHAGAARDFRHINNRAVTPPSTAMNIEDYSNVQFDFEFRPDNYVHGETTALDKRRTKLTKRRTKPLRHEIKRWGPDDQSPLYGTQAAPEDTDRASAMGISPSDTHSLQKKGAKTNQVLPRSTRRVTVREVKGIYAGLVMVESKCIEVGKNLLSEPDRKLSSEQWKALDALHRTLLYEHYDFLLASQHVSASPALRSLASRYAMPARLWRHGIYSFLELLRSRLPASLEQMFAFISVAYAMLSVIYEKAPAFEDTWFELLGDLGRCAIEDGNARDQNIWVSVSRDWYSKVSNKAPTTGRLHHHLAILARGDNLQQLFYFTKSLCVPIPFREGRDSIMTFFKPILDGTAPQRDDKEAAESIPDSVPDSTRQDETFKIAAYFSNKVHEVVFQPLRRHADPNILSYVHVVLVFIYYLARFPSALDKVEPNFPWKLASMFLNSILLQCGDYGKISSLDGPCNKRLPRPLPEDFAMRGLPWVDKYFPNDWFSQERIDADEGQLDSASTTGERKRRILWLGCQMASLQRNLTYDEKSREFGVLPQFEKDIELSVLEKKPKKSSTSGP